MNKQDFKQSENIAILCTEMKQVFKKLECLSNKIDKFDYKLDNMVRSFNDDKQHMKTYVDEKFATKKEVLPITNAYEKGKNKLASLGLFIIILLGTIGLAATGILGTIKEKLLK